jgi:hypothetical protein
VDVNITIYLPLVTAVIFVLCTAITQSARAIVAILALAPVVATVTVLTSVVAGVVPVASAEAVATVAVAGKEVVFGLYVSGGGGIVRLVLFCGKKWLTMRFDARPRNWHFQKVLNRPNARKSKTARMVFLDYPGNRMRSNEVSLKTEPSRIRCVEKRNKE